MFKIGMLFVQIIMSGRIPAGGSYLCIRMYNCVPFFKKKMV